MSTTTPLRAGLYERVSRVDKGDKKRARDSKRARSIEQQNAGNRAACAGYGWSITAAYADPGRSASRFTTRAREQYDQMLGDVDARRLDILVFWEGSRGGRELEAWAHLINACRAAGVKVYITDSDRLYDPDDADDEHELGSMGVQAAAESAKTSKRCLRAAGANAIHGRPHGRIPFGYARRYDPEDGELIGQVADPAAAPVVERIIGDIAAGQPVSAIVRDLNAGAVPGPTGGRWTRTQVTRMARNVVYIGKRRHNGGPLLDGDWPAIVDPGVFRDAQAVMAKRAGDGTRAGAQKWLLSYLGVCAVCGAGLGVRSRDGHLMYGCSNPAGGHCYARADLLEDLITRLVGARLSQPDVYASLTAGDDAAAGAARERAAGLRAELAEYDQLALAHKLTPARYAVMTAGLEEQITAADREAEAAAVPPVLRSLVASEDMRSRWDAMTVAARKDALRVLFSRIALRPRGRGRRSYDDDGNLMLDPELIEITWRTP